MRTKGKHRLSSSKGRTTSFWDTTDNAVASEEPAWGEQTENLRGSHNFLVASFVVTVWVERETCFATETAFPTLLEVPISMSVLSLLRLLTISNRRRESSNTSDREGAVFWRSLSPLCRHAGIFVIFPHLQQSPNTVFICRPRETSIEWAKEKLTSFVQTSVCVFVQKTSDLTFSETMKIALSWISFPTRTTSSTANTACWTAPPWTDPSGMKPDAFRACGYGILASWTSTH